MKRIVGFVVLIFIALIPFSLWAQKEEEQAEKTVFQFTDEVLVPQTSVKDQNRSGTCWSFSALSFFEAEILRTTKKEYDLSEMFVVYHNYHEKAEAYVRYHGTMEFSPGGSFGDVLEILKKYGVVPEGDYKGLQYGEDNHVHGELDNILRAYVDAVNKNANRHLTTAWLRGYDGILNAYLGELPTEFTYEKKKYTPKKFAESLGVNFNDYEFYTSYTHHPFYTPFVLEIQDNWRRGMQQNVPLDEMMEIIDNALKNGYSVAWGADVSEKGFMWDKGVAIMPEKPTAETAGMEVMKWAKMSKKERNEFPKNITEPVPEIKVTQELRQAAFDNWETTDDHGMVICGIAKDQKGTKYYKVKNSWTEENPYKGYFYASEAFVRYKTMNIMVNKNAVPKTIRQKCDKK
ncbi:MAG: aminopeptidase C [Bacteroides sp.]